MTINVKKKGNKNENDLANWLTDHGFKAWKDGMSGGGEKEKGDIVNSLDMTIETKACKNIKLMEWWRQTSKSASIHHNQPMLAIHQDGMPKENWLIVMDSHDWIEMLKDSKGHSKGQVVQEDNRQLKYKTEVAVRALKDWLKELNK